MEYKVEKVTNIGRAMRKLYEQYGASEVLTNEKYLINGLGDLVRIDYTPRLRSQLSLAMDAGLGRLYLEQLERGKPDLDFDRRALNLLIQQAGLNEAAAREITGYFNEMIGWTDGNRKIPATPSSPLEPPVPPKPPVSSPSKPRKGIAIGIIAGILAAIGAACCIILFSGGNGAGKSDNESKQSEPLSVQSNTKSNSDYQNAQSSEISNTNDLQEKITESETEPPEEQLQNRLMSVYNDVNAQFENLSILSIDYKNDSINTIKTFLENKGWKCNQEEEFLLKMEKTVSNTKYSIHITHGVGWSMVSFMIDGKGKMSSNNDALEDIAPSYIVQSLGIQSLDDLIPSDELKDITIEHTTESEMVGPTLYDDGNISEWVLPASDYLDIYYYTWNNGSDSWKTTWYTESWTKYIDDCKHVDIRLNNKNPLYFTENEALNKIINISIEY